MGPLLAKFTLSRHTQQSPLLSKFVIPIKTSQPPTRVSGPSADNIVCTGCGLLCNDYGATNQPSDSRCLVAGEWLKRANVAETTAFGKQVDLDNALKMAANQLLSSQRTLVTGLLAAPLEAIHVASQIAELIAAAVDGGLAESAQTTGPIIARAGEVTAAFEELRDRADLVIFWNCDPSITHPRFLERFIEPPLPAGRRQTISLGETAVIPSSATNRHFSLTTEQMVSTARLVQEAFKNSPAVPPATRPELLIQEITTAIQQANCIGFVSTNETDHLGISSWSLAELVRHVAHQKPAFQIPIGAGIKAGGPNAAGVTTSCTWRFGSPGAIGTANRQGSRFEPAEADARRLINRGEVDCLLVVGHLPRHLKEIVATSADPPFIIILTDVVPELIESRTIVLAVASLAKTCSGTMLREDGQLVRVIPQELSAMPTLEEMLTKLAEHIQQHLLAGS